ncbi:MAG: hypothetical protein QM726_23300 [Chitinophagaceae bacterium]
MNSPVNKPIVDFIEAFHLIQPDGLIHFWCKASYKSQNVSKEYTSQVFVVTIRPKKLDAIYLLDNSIAEEGWKDMFQISETNIEYIDKECLLIKDGDLEVRLFPIERPSTLNENPGIDSKDWDKLT